MFEWALLWDLLISLGIAIVLGGLLGAERELSGHEAGLRTHIMVSLGATVLILAGESATRTDPAQLSRVIQGVATGVGFIGAGAILKLGDRQEVRGVTTASSVWLAAAVGVVAGLRQYMLAGVCVLLGLFALIVLRPLSDWLEGRKKLGGKSEE